MNKFLKSVKKGFTLVELVVVIAIIAILAAVSVGGYFIYIGQAQQAELTTMKAEVITLVKSFTVAKTYEGVTFTYGTNGLTAMKGTVAASAVDATTALQAVINENHAKSEKKDGNFVTTYTKVEGIPKDEIYSGLTLNPTFTMRGICAVMDETTTSLVKSVWYVSSYEQAISIVL